MKIKKLSLQKDTLLPLDSAEAVNIAGGMVPVSTYMPLAGANACQSAAACSDPCGTGACPTQAATCQTCNTNCNQATCATCATNCGCPATDLTCRTDCRCASVGIRATCYC